jgi:predicted PurR-regulated permease PerM
MQLALVLGMVTCIHFVEAYLLNPAIYAAHLQLHPLLVLSVLVVAEHSLGVWGLLLAGTPPPPHLLPSIHEWRLPRTNLCTA